jgi:hypothetical protein
LSTADAAAVSPDAVEQLPAPPAGETDVLSPAAPPAQQSGGSMLPWALGALAIAAISLFFLFRRRREDKDTFVEQTHHHEPVASEPIQHVPAAPTPQAAPVASSQSYVAAEAPSAPLVASVSAPPAVTTKVPAGGLGASPLTAPVIGGFAAASSVSPAPEPMPEAPAAPGFAPTAAPTSHDRPAIGFSMRPVRAGVDGDGARVEFELTVGNSGPVAAEDVRVSTWMLASAATEAERALIAPAEHADTPPVTIPAGEERTLSAAVGLPTAEVPGDAVLPVVVADASFRLPDGSTGHATARFSVGVPDGEELAHFAVDNPSGLHEGVVARELGETERR